MPSHHFLTVGISLLTNFARLPVRDTQTGERNLPLDEAAKHHRAIAEFTQARPEGSTGPRHPLDWSA
ncbi:MAG: hypothetical protein HY674_23290 [Chloroflexi bacterium]|nr:hypothetical protein [Chloroflexota bacterium]